MDTYNQKVNGVQRNNNNSKEYSFRVHGKKYVVSSKTEEKVIRSLIFVGDVIKACKKAKSIDKKYTTKKRVKDKSLLGFLRSHPGISVGAIATAAIAIGSGNMPEPGISEDMYTIATIMDMPDDAYENSAPMKLEDGSKFEIGDNSLVIVKAGSIGKKNEVVYLDNEGQVKEGTIKGDYLHATASIEAEELAKYTDAYRVNGLNDGNLKSKPTQTDKYNVAEIYDGDIVLAGTPQVSSITDDLWYPVLSISEQGVVKGVLPEEEIDLVEQNVLNNGNNKRKSIEKNEEVIMVVDTSNDGKVPLKLRDNTNTSSKVLTQIDHKTEIRIPKTNLRNSVIMGEHNWVKISYNNKEGYIDKGYLKEKKKIERQVDTDNGFITLRADPREDADVLLNIPDGYILSMYEDDFEEKSTGIIDKKDWYKIDVCGIDGYIEADGLAPAGKIDREHIDIDLEEEYGKRKDIPFEANADGKVLILDFNGENVKLDDLADLLNNGISTYRMDVGEDDKNIDVGEYQGAISGVIIKIGATTAQRDGINISDKYFNRELVDFCESNGVPYGFYYFMGAETKEEAKTEWKYILKTINSFESREYNVLPFALDVEYGEYSRIKNDCTEAAIATTNALKSSGEKVMLYTSGGASIDEAGKIIDLEQYHKRTGVKNLWFVYPEAYKDLHEENFNRIPKYMNVAMTQNILDGKSRSGNIDISSTDAETFQMLVSSTYKNVRFTKRKDIEPNLQEKNSNKDDYEIGD